MPYKDREAKLANERARYERDGDRMRAAANDHYARNGERIKAARAAKRTDEGRARDAASQRERYAVLRAEVIATYGGRCECCGETEPKFLELDHTGDDGAEHRRVIGRGSHRCYQQAKRDGWPRDRFRLLCANCNQGRARNGGICPHVAGSPDYL